jgi:nitrite reductase (NADH) large subunit
MNRKRYVIIGDGAAGTTAAQTLRLADAEAQITIVSDDPHSAYFRASLTNYLLGELREDQVWAVPPTFYAELHIHRLLARVAGVDTANRVVMLAQGGPGLPYDALILASGARARPPPFEGGFLPGVMTMRTLQDVRTVMDLIRARNLKNAVVVGGGPLALEWAHGLSHRGVKVAVVAREPKFLPSSMDAVASDLLAARLRHGGVDVHMADEVAQALPGHDGRVASVVLKSGARLACELLAVAVGVICNTEFLRGSAITLAPNGAVLVTNEMRTPVPNVFACGDVAAVDGKLLQLWEPARVQGRVAAQNAQGGNARWAPGAFYMATRLYDLDFAGAGSIDPPDCETVVDFPQKTGKISYRKLWLQNGKLKSFMVIGERQEQVRKKGRLYKRLIDEMIDISTIKDRLLEKAFDLSGWLKPMDIQKPEQNTVQGAAVVKSAKMRGTQALSLSDMPKFMAGDAAPLSQAPPTQASPSGVMGGAMSGAVAARTSRPQTSILVMNPNEKPAPAFLESSRGRVELGARTVIGCAPDSQVVLNEPGVSDSHAQITRHGMALYIRDLGSMSGTWVNQKPVSVPVELNDGDHVRIGNTTFVLRMQQPSGGTKMSMPAISMPPSSLIAAREEGPRLIVRSGSGIGLSFAVGQGRTTIGRSPEATVRLDDPSIAAMHAAVELVGGLINVAPMQAAVVIRGVPIAQGQWTLAYEGDIISLGSVALEYANKSPQKQAPISLTGQRA